MLQYKISKDISSVYSFSWTVPIIPLFDSCDATTWISVYACILSYRYPESVQFQDIHISVIIYDYRENVSLAEEGASRCIMR